MRTVLGIDPGISILGYGIIQQQQRGSVLVDCGILKLSCAHPIALRLEEIYTVLTQKIICWSITEIALETPFLGKNAQNFLKLGYVRGIIYLLAAQHKLIIHEFAPRQIKAQITGCGHADKEQVACVMLKLFPGVLMPEKLDLTDALAIALCGIWKNTKDL